MRVRLVVTFVLVALLSAVTATALAYRDARTAVLQRTQNTAVDDLRERVATVAAGFDMPPDQRSLSRFAAEVSEGLGARIVVARHQDLTAVSDTYANTEGRITAELRAAVRAGDGTRFQRVEWRGEPYLVVGTPVTYADGDRRTSGLEVFAITDLRAERDDTEALLDSVQEGIVPVVAVAALLALLAAGTVLRPVRKLGRATRELAAGDLGSRVAVRGHDELADLARTFNETAGALQSSDAELRAQEAKARRFVADVSHELRTPLAAMAMVATVLEEDAGQLPPDAARAARTVGAETARLSRLVEDLMEISRFDAGAARLNASETDLADTVRASLAPRGWTDRVALDLPEGVRAVVDRRRVDVIVANLVGNALRHGAPPVTVTLAAVGGGGAPGVGEGGDRVVLEVADRGPGLPPEARERVFDRFYKADEARTRTTAATATTTATATATATGPAAPDGGPGPGAGLDGGQGSGLGMAIALENARLHGGTIEVEAQRPGGGAAFTLVLPLRRTDGEGEE
ncbi:HAMP domain-containing histidine kinase [Streptomyces californicus]|uniref:histidine kinase n=1 Tax=Streptomyces californicus TaxID=67351 RepID=A0ABD7DAZ2_9ACTN|nr:MULTISPECIES: HAMP domain-containing sensor histidine kinase [Streptomyces]QRV32158.1 HAMP domain-containing histidine kinase [Streptomyces californicus]QRV38693.1 HAMP domain-containing histidine kinase [Streptomyces californicus]QRV45574.1 HAMP domain-containing histidine kinase [Streptomyces californicus]QRV52248.1 HAMP domain-containing histidine kinase [Streptomyces californicus]